MAWYKDPHSLTSTQTYSSKMAAAEDASAAARYGWRIASQESSDGPNAVWAAYTPMGTSLARTRQQSAVVVTFVRTKDWLADTDH